MLRRTRPFAELALGFLETVYLAEGRDEELCTGAPRAWCQKPCSSMSVQRAPIYGLAQGCEARVGHRESSVYSCVRVHSPHVTSLSQLVLASSSPPALAAAASASTPAITAASGTASAFVASSSAGLSAGSGAGGASVAVAA